MQVLPFEIVIHIATRDPVAFVRLMQASKRIYKYTKTVAGRTSYIHACAYKDVKHLYTAIHSRITGKMHSFFNQPAVICSDGARHWYHNGDRHRMINHASLLANGDREWWQYGKLHRDGAPAIVRVDGTHLWYQAGELHRDNGPAILRPDGHGCWIQHGEFDHMD